MPGLEDLSDADLDALEAGDITRISDKGLFVLESAQAQQPQPSAKGRFLQAVDIARKPLQKVAEFGRRGAAEAQRRAEVLAEKKGLTGAIVGGIDATAAEFLLPQTELEAALLPLSIPGKAAKAAVKGTGKIAKAGPIAKLVGSLATVRTAIPERYTQYATADPIGLKTAPSIKEVASRYAEAFKQAGMRINSALFKRVTGSRFPPTETEVGKLQRMIDVALDKLKEGKLAEDEAFIARSAAASIERSEKFARGTGEYRRIVTGAKDDLDNFLENSSLPNIRALSRDYFRAVAKERFDHWLPQNKNLSPNALRSLLMTETGLAAAGALFTGQPGLAALGALHAASMSPKVVGAGLKAFGSARQSIMGTRPIARAAIPLTGTRAFRDKEDRNPEGFTLEQILGGR